MRKKLYITILFSLVVSSELVFGKDSSHQNKTNKGNKSHDHSKDKTNIERIKRSLDDDEEKLFWANRGKKQIYNNPYYNQKNDYNYEKILKLLKDRDMEEEPFWGTRGRRESGSIKNHLDEEYPESVSYVSNCNDCYGNIHKFSNRAHNLKNLNDNSEEPFWGVRGRRDSSENEDSFNFFLGNRGRRQDNNPFWGMRGRRKDDPFWGARGRRDDEPFWGNRGRRDDNEPFWGNRGRRQENEPFWGNRGRRQEPEPFWGDKRQRDDEPFWGNRGRRKYEDVFWGSRGRRKEDLKDYIVSAINNVERDIEYLSRLKKSKTSFWSNRGRDNTMKLLFTGTRGKIELPYRHESNLKFNDPATMTDSRMYADEPNYILVERNSRSSGEVDDPFYITRGKKYYLNYKLFKAARDRRGALEEIVKSVRNDPYYIARGKKDDSGNTNNTNGGLTKVKELICSAIDLMNVRDNEKVKREIDTDRDRRTILKKLTAQLQNDPYFVSRGKKSDNVNNDDVRVFITEIAKKCY